MEKIAIKEAIVVEGRYDKNTLSQVVEGLILVTHGFGIFSDKAQMALLQKVAKEQGLIVLTDSDGAGFVIRHRISSVIDKKYLKHAYIPDIKGKEKRKVTGSKEGTLGVEGMSPQVLREVLSRCGANFSQERRNGFTTGDFLRWGLTGEGSQKKREILLGKLGLPKHMTKKAMLEMFCASYQPEEILGILQEMEEDEGCKG